MESASSDPGLDRALLEEQTAALYAKGATALAFTPLTSSVLVAALWHLVPHTLALAWLGALWVTVAGRALLWSWYRRTAHSRGDAGKWGRRWVASSAFTGAIWGAGGVLLYSPHQPGAQNLLYFVIGGMVAGASSSMGSRLGAFLAFSLPALLPGIARLLMEHERSHTAMAIVLVMFLFGMTSVTLQGARTLTESVRLRLRNVRLADELMLVHRGLEQRVAERTHELERAIRERDDFVSVVSHELRSPLSAMTLQREILQEIVRHHPPDESRLQRSLQVMARQIDRLRHIIDDLFDTMRMSTERMRYTMELQDLRTLIDESLEELTPQLLQHEARFAVEVEPGMCGYFDRYRIEQAIVNLMSNALKHGAQPFSISAQRVDDCARIVVHDSGAGIPGSELERVFDPFVRGASSASGLGLGLHIAQRIVHAHHGTIRAESAAGQGTSFILELPLASESVGEETRNSHARGAAGQRQPVGDTFWRY